MFDKEKKGNSDSIVNQNIPNFISNRSNLILLAVKERLSRPPFCARTPCPPSSVPLCYGQMFGLYIYKLTVQEQLSCPPFFIATSLFVHLHHAPLHAPALRTDVWVLYILIIGLERIALTQST